ncbi:hypothetical protein LPB04_23315 [Massilia litorea]|uniref:Uncharacterized protein n=1 Tax=Massilia litorea TaxID=2769491 RepID=A0A7L9UAV6_9BURK|nr:hypothetical protein LPB04_23315 [Massilia litorea]
MFQAVGGSAQARTHLADRCQRGVELAIEAVAAAPLAIFGAGGGAAVVGGGQADVGVAAVTSPDRSTAIVSVELAPIWNFMALATVPPTSSLAPPKVVFFITLPSSRPSASNSSCMASLSAWVDDWSAGLGCQVFHADQHVAYFVERAFGGLQHRSRILGVTHCNGMPLVCAFRRVAICRPAASSIAELMR